MTSAVPIPLLVAGGAKNSTHDMLNMVERAMKNGGSGVCIGRQVFAHESPRLVARALVMIVHEDASAEDAIKATGL